MLPEDAFPLALDSVEKNDLSEMPTEAAMKKFMFMIGSVSLFCFVFMLGSAFPAEETIPKGWHAVARNHLNNGLELMRKRVFHYAKGEFHHVIKLKYDTGLKSVAYLNLGVIDFMEGNLDKAIKNYRSAIELNPDYVEAYFNLGAAYYKQGNLKEAETALLKAIELEPEYARAHYSLGALYFDQKKYELARKHADKAEELGISYKTLKEKLAKVKQ